MTGVLVDSVVINSGVVVADVPVSWAVVTGVLVDSVVVTGSVVIVAVIVV